LKKPHTKEGGTTKKELVMSFHGHTTVWGTHLGIGRAPDAKRWYQQLRDWWTTHRPARQQATRTCLHAGWDAQHESYTPLRADAARDLVAAQGHVSIANQVYSVL
jgi:hypothetical protein